jgi:hypothetical protein
MSKLVELDAAPSVGARVKAHRERQVDGVRFDAERDEHVVTLAEDDTDRGIYDDPEVHMAHLDAMTADGWQIEAERALRVYLVTSFTPKPATVEDALRDAAAVAERVALFWSDAAGWAPQETIDVLADARLDWMSSLARGLARRVEEIRLNPDDPGARIVAWVHLRSLTEGYIRLFFTVYITDYLADPKMRRKAVLHPKDDLTLDQLKRLLEEKELLKRHLKFIDSVRVRGNAIHPFLHRDIGTVEDFEDHVRAFVPFLRELAGALPMPHHDEVISPRPDVGCWSTRPISERPPWDR